MCTVYQDVEYIYPDITVFLDNEGEWTVMRNDGGVDTDGAGMSVKVRSDGTLYDLCYGGE